MPRPTDIQIRNVTVETERIDYRSPIKFGGRVVTEAVLLNGTVEVETANGRRGSGFGSMPMGNVWAWPSSVVSAAQSLEAMLQFALAAAAAARDHLEFGHPLDLTRELAAEHAELAAAVAKKLCLAEPMPKLAEMVAASPLEAAIHDTYGKVHQANSYNVLGPEFVAHDLAHYLAPEFSGEYLDRYTLR